MNPGSIPGSGRSTGDGIGCPLQYSWASLMAHMVKNLPAMWETWVRALAWEDPLKKGMATHSSILAWRIPWTEEPGRLQSMGSQRVRHKRQIFTFTFSQALLGTQKDCQKAQFRKKEIIFKIVIGIWLLYNVMLVSAVQQSESVIHIHISTLFFRFPPHLGHHRSVKQVFISHLFYTQ